MEALLYALKIKDLFYVGHACVEDNTGVVNVNFRTTGSRPYYKTLTIKQLILMRN